MILTTTNRSFAQRMSAILVVFFLTSCGNDPAEPASDGDSTDTLTGRIQVTVVDLGIDKRPVEGVPIRILPTDEVLDTDQNGVAVFELPAGDYSVKADVCCLGPGWIRYEEPATVASGTTTTVRLSACLECL